jgi:Bacterial Ig-like domain (group 3)
VKTFRGWKRWSAALAAIAAAVPIAASATAPAPAGATPVRTATTTSYTTATFLQHDLGLPSSDTSPAIQPVTYDEFQWLLQQSGNYAFLIGDPATDANFATEAQEVEASAAADGAKAVYWFDPNLSGGGYFTTTAGANAASSPAGTAVGTALGTGTKAIYEPNLDIREPSTIGEVPSTSTTGAAPTVSGLTSATQTAYGYAWDNLIAQYLGDGVSEFLAGVDTESAKVDLAEFGANTGTYTNTVNKVSTTYTVGNGQSYIADPTQNDAIEPVNTAVNDYGSNPGYSTQISNGSPNTSGGALYDYSSGSAPATVDKSFFLTYNKADTVTVSGTPEPEKITNWIDLDTESSSSNLETDVTTALNVAKTNTAGGASGLSAPTQFDWWESEATAKANEIANGTTALATSLPANGQNGDTPLLTSADDQASDGGFRVEQIPYPELVDLLKSGATSSNAVILFGGTWCPNTRPVLPFINKYAQQNDVTVFNFDTVLDGGTTGGGTTSSTDPLQSRNSASATSGSTVSANPTFLYGDLVSKYLSNIQTQYNPTVGDGSVTYYPGGNGSSTTLTTVNKLQVPFLIGYQQASSLNSDASSTGGVTRQWINEQTDSSGLPYYIEYMSDWPYTDPQPYELGIGTNAGSGIPQDAPIWSTINSEVANLTAQTTPASVDPNTAIDSDDANYLDSADYAQVNLTLTSGIATGVLAPTAGVSSSATASSTATSVTTAAISISPASLSTALSALGASAPVNYAAAKTALLAAYNGSSTSTLTTNLETVDAAWGVAQTRKNAVSTRFGNANNPASLIGAAQAISGLNVFFGGLPGGVVSTQSVVANPVSYGTAPKISIAISNDYERVPTSNVSLVVQRAGATVATGSTAVSNGVASFMLPVLTPGTYSYTLSYPGDSQLLAFTNTGSVTVSEDATQPGLATDVSAAPTARAAGSYRITIGTPSGLATPTGTVTVKLSKGSTTRTVTGELADGGATVSVPKLAAGAWGVAVSWAGDSNYGASTWSAGSIDVARVKPDRLTGSVAKAPSSSARGRYKVKIATPSGFSDATGKVVVKLRKGSTTKTVSGRLARGAVTITVPKLGAGTWKIAIAWGGDSNYLAAHAAGESIKVAE